jgi:acyl-coenzyme A thioesterase PaaI-like protein
MNVEYVKPLTFSKGEITVCGRIVSVEKRTVQIECALYDGEGVEYAKAQLSYFYYPERVAKARFHYPGIEAFYE